MRQMADQSFSVAVCRKLSKLGVRPTTSPRANRYRT